MDTRISSHAFLYRYAGMQVSQILFAHIYFKSFSQKDISIENSIRKCYYTNKHTDKICFIAYFQTIHSTTYYSLFLYITCVLLKHDTLFTFNNTPVQNVKTRTQPGSSIWNNLNFFFFCKCNWMNKYLAIVKRIWMTNDKFVQCMRGLG